MLARITKRMADDPPEKKPAIGRTRLGATIGDIDPERLQELSRKLGAMRLGLGKSEAETQPEKPVPGLTREEPKEVPHGAVIGGGNDDKPTKPTRTRRGRVTTRGRHRVMNHWEIFDSELNELAGLQKDAQRAYTATAFLAALALDIFRDIATSDDMVGLARVFWVVLAACAAAGAFKFWRDARYYEQRGGNRLQQIKDEHDDDC
jgi:hypothetical protein